MPRSSCLVLVLILTIAVPDAPAAIPSRTKPAQGAFVSMPPQVRIDKDRVELENGHFLAVIATQPVLQLRRLVNRHAASECLAAGQSARMFAVAADDRLVAHDRWKVVKTEGKPQPDGSQLVSITLRAEALSAELIGRVDSSWQTRWRLEITNGDSGPRRLRLYWLLDHLMIGREASDNYYFYPFKGGWSGNRPYHLGHGYGTPTGSLQVVSVFNPALGGGVCLWIADSSGAMKTFWLRKVDSPGVMPPSYESLGEQLRAGSDGVSLIPLDLNPSVSLAVSPPARSIDRGAKLSLPEMVIGVHPGDWHEALAGYTGWVRTWWRPPQAPRWLWQAYNICAVHHHESIHKMRYTTAERILPSHQMFQWSQWWENPSVDRLNRPKPGAWYQGAMGDYAYEPRWGGLEALKSEVARVRKAGGRTVFLVQNYLVWKHSKLAKEHAADWAARTESGQPRPDWTGEETNMDVWDFCVGLPAYQDHVADVCRRVIRETGGDGIYLDSAPDAFACHDRRHGHGNEPGRFSLDMLRKVRAAIRQASPEAMLHIEDICSEHHLQHVDGAWLKEFEMYPPMSTYAPNFDAYPVYFLRFYFPEVWFADWGAGDDGPGWRRCFFNGIGVCRWPNDYTARTGRIMRENAAAFGSLHPEPIVPTEKDGVFANRFPAKDKTIYTLYNRNATAVSGGLIRVLHQSDCHYVELMSGREVAARIQGAQAILELEIPAGEVAAIAQLPRILALSSGGDGVAAPRRVVAKLLRPRPQAKLVILKGDDPNQPGQALPLNDQSAEIALSGSAQPRQHTVVQLFVTDELADQVRWPAK